MAEGQGGSQNNRKANKSYSHNEFIYFDAGDVLTEIYPFCKHKISQLT
jgi:hypothetical protein